MLASKPGRVIITQAEGLTIPQGIDSLERFREWCRSETFPDKGRIDWIDGDLEIDMSPEEGNTHGAPKTAIAAALNTLIVEADRGVVYVDAMRVVAPAAGLSVEPDVVVVLFSTLKSGVVTLGRPASGASDRFVEIEGAPDIAVECVSETSTSKDRKHLREKYFTAGVAEYWIVDARRAEVELQILRRGTGAFEDTATDGDGFLRSEVLDRHVKLVRRPPIMGVMRYRLEVRA